MPAASPGAWIGFLLASLTLLAAGWLGLRQWTDHQRRSPHLPEPDRLHFARQDLRRGLGVVLLVVLGLGLSILIALGPARDRPSARILVWGWLGLCVALLALLTLALGDWAATNAYARRHRREHRASLNTSLNRPESRPPGPHANGVSPPS